MTNLETAKAFFDSCENGNGWEDCKKYCSLDAKFRGQGGVFHPPQAPQPNLGGSLENYTDWMKLIAKQVMPGSYLTDVVYAYDPNSTTALFSATFNGKHTETPEGVPLPPPTQRTVASDYVYKIHLNEDGKIDNLVEQILLVYNFSAIFYIFFLSHYSMSWLMSHGMIFWSFLLLCSGL